MSNPKSNHGKILLWISIASLIGVFTMFGVTLRKKAVELYIRQQSSNLAFPIAPTKAEGMPAHPASAEPKVSQTPRTPDPQPQDSRLPDPVGWTRMKAYSGKWSGMLMDGETMKVFSFELREDPVTQGGFSGYSSVLDIPLGIPANGQKPVNPQPINPLVAIYGRMVPNAVLWSGTPDRNGIAFHLDKRVGKSKCGMDSLTITPFGNSQLVAEWKSEGCPDGQVLLSKGDR